MTVKNSKRSANGDFKEGHSGNPNGRPRGSKNKVSRSVQENYETAFDVMGGVEGLVEWANKNNRTQGMFYQMYSKMLPTNVGIDGNISLNHNLSMTDLKKSMDNCKGEEK